MKTQDRLPSIKLPLQVIPSLCHGQAVVQNADEEFIFGARMDQAEDIAHHVNTWGSMREALEAVSRLDYLQEHNALAQKVRNALKLAERIE